MALRRRSLKGAAVARPLSKRAEVAAKVIFILAKIERCVEETTWKDEQ